MTETEKLTMMANAIRALSMDAVQAANSGHPGMPMGMADVATILFNNHLKFDPQHPEWADRDRFVLSAGHGSMLLYSLLYLTGYEDMTIEELKNFRQLGAKTAGHPEYGHAAGIEVTTGPLGQGISTAVGLAIAEERLRAEFGQDLMDHHTYVIAGDGCLMEGISQEAVSLAGHLKLNKLIVLWDDNDITIDGAVNLSDSTDQLARFEASGWTTSRIDGHDLDAIDKAIEQAKSSDKPVLIACKTVIGKGSPNKGGTSGVHGAPLGDDEIKLVRDEINWPHPSFNIPSDCLDQWRLAGLTGSKEHKAWKKRCESADKNLISEFNRRQRGDLPAELDKKINTYKAELATIDKAVATRKSSQNALEVINPVLPEILAGSADLTGSNNTKTDGLNAFTADNRAGGYLYYGIREHGMAAAMNGIALHGGLIPYGGTFLVFADYCRPSIRLAALMGIRVIYVFTHDSIGLGEDGPTHQPVEHLASLRAIPNLRVYRPADAVETLECWQLALQRTEGPSVLALSRQNLDLLRKQHYDNNRCELGAYIISRSNNDTPQVCLFASGSEVGIAMDAATILEAENIATRVISVPCMDEFKNQSPQFREEVLGDTNGNSCIRIGIEAGIEMGWHSILGDNGHFIGMQDFGASAPAPDLYKHFGITAERIAETAREALKQQTS